MTHLALTHPHFDHVLGAAAFAGVEIFGAVGVDTVLDQGRDELRADAVAQGLDPAAAAEAADLLVHPRHLVCGEWTLDLGGIQVLLANVGPGHSGHDLVVLVPGDADGGPEVVFCGDLVEESGEPQAGPDEENGCRRPEETTPGPALAKRAAGRTRRHCRRAENARIITDGQQRSRARTLVSIDLRFS